MARDKHSSLFRCTVRRKVLIKVAPDDSMAEFHLKNEKNIDKEWDKTIDIYEKACLFAKKNPL